MYKLRACFASSITSLFNTHLPDAIHSESRNNKLNMCFPTNQQRVSNQQHRVSERHSKFKKCKQSRNHAAPVHMQYSKLPTAKILTVLKEPRPISRRYSKCLSNMKMLADLLSLVVNSNFVSLRLLWRDSSLLLLQLNVKQEAHYQKTSS